MTFPGVYHKDNHFPDTTTTHKETWTMNNYALNCDIFIYFVVFLFTIYTISWHVWKNIPINYNQTPVRVGRPSVPPFCLKWCPALLLDCNSIGAAAPPAPYMHPTMKFLMFSSNSCHTCLHNDYVDFIKILPNNKIKLPHMVHTEIWKMKNVVSSIILHTRQNFLFT